MARAAVRAKQAQQAQAAAAAAKPRRDRKHASGGNPNQDLFFSRLRRKQRWVFIGLAVIFAVSFAALGVGTGGAGLSQMWNGIFGGGNDAVANANAEIKSGNQAKGYRDLADAYIRQNNTTSAITAMEQYLQIKKTDAQAWALLGGYEKTQGDTYGQEYQQLAAYAQIQSPSSALTPAGTLGTQLGTNPIDEFRSKQYQAQLTPLYQQASTAYSHSLTAYQNAAKYAKASADKATYEYQLALAAQNQNQTQVALTAWKNYVRLEPHSPYLSQVEAYCKQLGGSCVPKKHKTK